MVFGNLSPPKEHTGRKRKILDKAQILKLLSQFCKDKMPKLGGYEAEKTQKRPKKTLTIIDESLIYYVCYLNIH
jgi:hypothetical protein